MNNPLGALADAMAQAGGGGVLGFGGGAAAPGVLGAPLASHQLVSAVRNMAQQARAQNAARAQVARQERAQFAAAAAMGQQDNDDLKRAPLGLGRQDIFETATTATLSSTAQKPFQASRLFIVGADTGTAASAAGIDLVTSIQVGVDNQLVGADALPLDAFSPDSVGVGISGSLNAISQQMQVGVQRFPAPGAAASGAQRSYSGMAMGRTVGS